MVGQYVGADGRSHGFRWERGRSTTIDVPGSAGTAASDINDRGDIVGATSNDPAGLSLRGFLLSRGIFTTFAAPGVPITGPFGINDRGQIVGFTYSDPVGTEAHGFLLATGVEGAVHADRLPGRAPNHSVRHQRQGPDRRRLRGPGSHAGWPAEPHADANDDVAPLTADRPIAEVPAKERRSG